VELSCQLHIFIVYFVVKIKLKSKLLVKGGAMTIKSFTASEFMGAFKPGDQFWWICPRLAAGLPSEVKGPLTLIRFSQRILTGIPYDTVEYRDSSGSVFCHFVLALTNEVNGVFKGAEDANVCAASRTKS
jgi:hypothetical protein